MRVLVTGSTGRLGSLLVRALQADAHQVRAMSSRPGTGVVHAGANARGSLTYAEHLSSPDQT